jgi:serine protease Do
VAGVLPAVALIVNHRVDGRTGYGAGVLLDRGRVLTNLHVVSYAVSLQAMLYDPDRPSYTALDGGLTRFLGENASALVTATLLETDEGTDLAIVRIDTNTAGRPRLPFRTTPLRVGERVVAVGHPGESVWSVTLGFVSALHVGAIQHDAVIMEGSSGGPLLDADGNVVGINTSRLLGIDRMSFARPIAMMRGLPNQKEEPVALRGAVNRKDR